MILAGQLRHRVTIEAPARTESPQSGEVRLAFAAAKEVWADVHPLTARERSQHGQAGQAATHQVTMRYTPVVTPACRLRFKGRVLNITGIVNVDERDRELRIAATEVS